MNVTLKSKFSDFSLLKEIIIEVIKPYKIDKDKLTELLIAAEEIFTNIIRHAYNEDETQIIDISIDIVGDFCVMEFKDYGRGLCQLNIPYSLNDLNQKIGGLGLYLISKFTDNYDYKKYENHNIQMLKKRIINAEV